LSFSSVLGMDRRLALVIGALALLTMLAAVFAGSAEARRGGGKVKS
jgi:hypothetical protein